MRTCFVLLILVILVPPVGAATIWDVEYFIRGDISQVTHFYGTGAYAFLWSPNYTTVYIQNGNWTFTGMYGEAYGGYAAAVLPEGFPAIAFPAGFDEAIAVPISGPVDAAAAVPEPGTGVLFLAGGVIMAALIAASERRAAPKGTTPRAARRGYWDLTLGRYRRSSFAGRQ